MTEQVLGGEQQVTPTEPITDNVEIDETATAVRDVAPLWREAQAISARLIGPVQAIQRLHAETLGARASLAPILRETEAVTARLRGTVEAARAPTSSLFREAQAISARLAVPLEAIQRCHIDALEARASLSPILRDAQAATASLRATVEGARAPTSSLFREAQAISARLVAPVEAIQRIQTHTLEARAALSPMLRDVQTDYGSLRAAVENIQRYRVAVPTAEVLGLKDGMELMQVLGILSSSTRRELKTRRQSTDSGHTLLDDCESCVLELLELSFENELPEPWASNHGLIRGLAYAAYMFASEFKKVTGVAVEFMGGGDRLDGRM